MNEPIPDTKPSIRILDDATVHLIAAGEVVDRPVSIVKELVENSIDAGSSRITVDVSANRGEISRIRIVDDGKGIPPEEIPLAFIAHATSKIRSSDDLETCLTLGFRGEALASIAAVSYVTLVTSTSPSRPATRYRVTGGEVVECSETGAPPGTSITVEEIFYNTPARRKFLKSLHTELAHISAVVESFACLYPHITFRYLVNSQEKFSTHGGSSLPDIFRALHPDEAGSMIPVSRDEGDIRLSGLVSLPGLVKQNRQQILIGVNGRIVQSPAITSAIKRAYGSLVPSASWPVSVLMLTLPPAMVDANIHPTKREVRFSAEKKILDLIVRIVRDSLAGADIIGCAPDGGRSDQAELPERTGYAGTGRIPYQSPVSTARKVCETALSGYRTTSRQLLQTRIQDIPESQPDERFPAMYWIGQVGGTYIIAGGDDGSLYLIDQHAAHERVRYEQVKNQESLHLKTQELIAPVVLNLTPSEVTLLSSVLQVIEEEGFILEPFGQDTWCVRGVPVILGRYEDPETIREIISSILSGDEAPVRLKEQVLRLVACRSAVKAGAVLTPEQGMDIITQLSRTLDPWTCPHGRPTVIGFPAPDLARMFRRT
ncbi:MAG: DNA mismatch repair endonuclease MutL [Methanospirillum sp.]|nr:DNA mismatch repair endonuclease MutL [Methanospirillum sp.]